MLDRLRPYLPLFLTILVAVAGGNGVALYLDDEDPATAPVKIIDFRAAQTSSTEITLPATKNAPEQTIVADTDQQVSRAEQKAAASDATPGLHEDAKDEMPPGVSKERLEAGREKTEELADEQLNAPQEVGGAQAYSCPPRYVVNQSALGRRRVGVALHLTVSNPGSLDAIRRLFNTPSFGASSNYGFELFNLRCQQWVPESRKAWTQGAFNSDYVSIEIITNLRTRSAWLNTPAFRRGVLAALVRDIALRHGAPLKLVDPVGCTARPGITDHDRLECGNTHVDVGTGFPWDVFMRQVRRGAQRARPVLYKPERVAVARRCYHRSRLFRTSGERRLRHLAYARRWIRVIGRQRAALRRLGLSGRLNRAQRHRILGGYATGRSCR